MTIRMLFQVVHIITFSACKNTYDVPSSLYNNILAHIKIENAYDVPSISYNNI
jgi:hypothetical protein